MGGEKGANCYDPPIPPGVTLSVMCYSPRPGVGTRREEGSESVGMIGME